MRRFGHVHTPGNIDERGYCQTAIVVAVELTGAGVPFTVTIIGWSGDGTQFRRKSLPYREGTVLADGDSYHPEGECPYGR